MTYSTNVFSGLRRLKMMPIIFGFVISLVVASSAADSMFPLLATASAISVVFLGLLLKLDPVCIVRETGHEQLLAERHRAVTRTTLIPAIASLLLMSFYLGFQAYSGMKLFEHLSFEELGALTYLIASISWMLIKFCSLIGVSNERLGQFFRESESVILNVFLIAFYVSLKAVFNISP